jgi:long-chain acyl-CoA synthetase
MGIKEEKMDAKHWHRHYDHDTPTTIRYPRLAVHELIGLPANAYPDKAALNFFGTEMTFWELRLQVLRFANALGTLGIQKGERVGIHLPNCPQYPIVYELGHVQLRYADPGSSLQY